MRFEQVRRSFLLGVGLVLAPAFALAQNFDFGDIPDPTFPTAQGSTSSGFGVGPFHFDVSHEWISLTSNTTTVEAAAKMTDLDEDDGFIAEESCGSLRPYSDGANASAVRCRNSPPERIVIR